MLGFASDQVGSATARREVSLVPVPYSPVRYLPWRVLVPGALLAAILIERLVGVSFVGTVGLCVAAVLTASAITYFRARIDCRHFRERNGSARLYCSGNPSDLRPLESIQDWARQPYVVQFKGLSPTDIFTSAVIVMGLAGCLSISWAGGSRRVAVGVLVCAFVVDCVVCLVIRPTYYRVYPHVLEILQYRWSSKRVPVSWVVRLDTATIVCRLERGELTIADGKANGTLKRIPLYGIANVGEFVIAVFECALCSWASPALPEKELCG